MQARTDSAPKPGPGGHGKRDLTTGPIGSTLIAFALPVMGANILQSVNASANAIWVSHVLGETALAAISNANQIIFLLLGAAFGVSMAANILIGQAMGAADHHLVRRIVGSSTTFFILLSVTVGALGVTLTPHILDAMDTPDAARGQAIAYLRVIFTAMPFMYFFSYVMIAQRGAGDSRTPFFFFLGAVVMDVVLNPLLILGVGPLPRLGIAGSATSTLVSQTLTLTAMLVHLYRKKSVLVLRPGEFHLLVPDGRIVRSLVLKGLPMGLQMVVMSLAAVTMMAMVNGFGVQSSAAYGAATQLWTYVQMPAMALGAAVSSMAAQNVGAGRMDRVERVALVGGFYGFLFGAGPVLVLYLANPWVLQAFLPADSPSLPIAVHINNLVLWGFVASGVGFIVSGLVRSTGAVWPPLLAMVIAMWGVRVPLAMLLRPYLGADAIWISYPVGSLGILSLSLAYYRWGGWRNSRMLPHDRPSADAPDTGLAQPMVEESEAVTEAALSADPRRSAPSGRNR